MRSRIIFLLIVFWAFSISPTNSSGAPVAKPRITFERQSEIQWQSLEKTFRAQREAAKTDGVSYVISGSSAVLLGIFGELGTQDPIDRAVYSVFQVIGIASVGYGIHKWIVSPNDELVFESLRREGSLTPEEKWKVMQNYFILNDQKKADERMIKAVTHGLVTALNLYGANNQSNPNIKNGLYFLAGVNLLAFLSFTF